MANEILESIKSNLDTLESLPQSINTKLSNLDKEQNDILHSIEFSKFSASDGYKLAKRLQDIRVERRQHKEIQEELVKVRSVIDSYKNIKTKVGVASKSVKEVKSIQEKRRYHTRTIDKKDDIAKLKSVNKTNIRFRDNPQMDKMDKLFEQIKQGE